MILAAACGFSGWLAYPNKVIPPPNGGLIVDEKELDFGEAWEDRAFPWKFTIHNPTAADVTINKFWNSCSCAAVKPESVTIPAGGQATVGLALDLRAAFLEKAPSTAAEEKPAIKAPFEAEIVPEIGDLLPKKAWQIRGRVGKVLSASPASLYLADQFIRGQPFPKRQIKLTAHAQLDGIVVTCPPEYCHVEAKRCRHDGSEWELDTTLAPNLPAGPFKFKIVVQPFCSTATALPPTFLVVEGVVTDSVTALPSAMLLGARSLGTSVKETVTLQRNVDTKFNLISVEDCPKSTRVTPLTDSNRVDIEFTIEASGQHTHTIYLVLEPDGGGAPIRVPVTVSYYGLLGVASPNKK